jgi:hypothetical protein
MPAITGASLRTTGGSTGGVIGLGFVVLPPQLAAANAATIREA